MLWGCGLHFLPHPWAIAWCFSPRSKYSIPDPRHENNSPVPRESPLIFPWAQISFHALPLPHSVFDQWALIASNRLSCNSPSPKGAWKGRGDPWRPHRRRGLRSEKLQVDLPEAALFMATASALQISGRPNRLPCGF